jgi:hypothetical protein
LFRPVSISSRLELLRLRAVVFRAEDRVLPLAVFFATLTSP